MEDDKDHIIISEEINPHQKALHMENHSCRDFCERQSTAAEFCSTVSSGEKLVFFGTKISLLPQ